jgi:phosphoribosylformylglycinamidine synthase
MIYRIDVRGESVGGQKASADPLGEATRRQITDISSDPGPIHTRRIFLIDSDADRGAMQRVADELLADPIAEAAELVAGSENNAGESRIEIHLKPGVMDPVAASTEMAIRDLGIHVTQVRTGRSFVFEKQFDRPRLEQIAGRVLANGVIESVHFQQYVPAGFETGHLNRFQLQHVAIRELSDEQLVQLSREAHLFLSLAEMKAIQSYYREQNREPTDVEMETIAQTWSEHCVHKTLKSAVEVEVRGESGKVVETRRYKNLIKETIFASTKRLMEGRGSREGEDTDPFCLSVFSDNAGVIAFDETDAVCFKVETHNHPSAIEPYGGSATGIGGVIRDILGTGLGAKPVGNTDVFCVASHDYAKALPRGVIHPRRILQQIVAGVRDYGNRMGIPTVNGAVYFDDRYLGNPMVFCGCVGLIPRDKIFKQSHPGDAVVVVGGRTGRDGIHGATFSSAELTDTHADEFSHAVQIGNAITEKKVADVILEARDRGLFTAITDCGAGGLSSAVGEMGEKIGAEIALEKVPLKYAGLRHDEIWISEAQERMVLSVPKEKLGELLALAAEEDVEATVIGHFGTEKRELILHYHDTEVARLSMEFLHNGIPMPTRKAVVESASEAADAVAPAGSHGLSSTLRLRPEGEALATKETLLKTLASPNIASKHWIIRQYDHEVQGGSVIKPLTGPLQIGPSDAAVVRPKLGSQRGVVLGCGLSPQIADAYDMTLAAIDEAVRNVVAVGADLSRVAILDNFCWPSVDDEKTMGTLVRSCEACRDAALAYGIPFISGKDSLHNQFTNQETGEVIRIPRTLLISAIGVIDDVRKCVTMDFKKAGNRIAVVSAGKSDMSGRVTLHRAFSQAVGRGLVTSCHDSSDGGLATAIAEMCIASGLGADIRLDSEAASFEETLATYVIEYEPGTANDLQTLLGRHFEDCGVVVGDSRLQIDLAGNIESVSIAEMTAAWRGTLDW